MKGKIKGVMGTGALGLLLLLQTIGAGPAFGQSMEMAFQADPDSQIIQVNYAIKFWEPANKDCLIFAVTIKNISDKPERFKISVKAEGAPFPAAAFVPLTGNPPQLAPQKEASTALPFYFDKIPRKVFVRVEKVD